VYDYVEGKADWLAHMLPREGTKAGVPNAGECARKGVPTCRPDETIAAARARANQAGWDHCVVVGAEDVVLGVLRPKALHEAPEEATAEAIMTPGPSTFRPHVPLDEILDYMNKHDIERYLITTPEGVLVGELFCEDVEESHARSHARANDSNT
jgi:predicted transcriptional regulator